MPSPNGRPAPPPKGGGPEPGATSRGRGVSGPGYAPYRLAGRSFSRIGRQPLSGYFSMKYSSTNPRV